MQYFSVLEDHEDFLVIHKAPDVSVQTEQDSDFSFIEHIKNTLQLPELYLCHRLDKVTSGVMVLAKHYEANRVISMAFEKREVEKTYLAISQHKPKKKQGWVKGDMEKARRGAYKLLRSTSNPAVTYFTSSFIPPKYRLFIVKPHTGKTHQIRVALKSIGAPIWGDPLYAEAVEARQADRTYLHAYQLKFMYCGKNYAFTAMPEHGELFKLPEIQTFLAQTPV